MRKLLLLTLCKTCILHTTHVARIFLSTVELGSDRPRPEGVCGGAGEHPRAKGADKKQKGTETLPPAKNKRGALSARTFFEVSLSIAPQGKKINKRPSANGVTIF